MAERTRFLLVACVLLLSGCAGSTTGTPTPSSPASGTNGGLIAYASATSISVVDPATDKAAIIAPLPAGAAFRVGGPAWGPAPGLSYPVIYFTIHDDRPPERRTTAGVVPYDWLFRADPFTGSIVPLGASADFDSEGPFGVSANSHFLAMTVGCCTDYQVDVLDLTQPNAPIKVLTRPPTQPALFTEGAAPGVDGLIAVRGFATGAWYFLNPSLGVLNHFPLTPGPDDGPVAFSPDGTMAAVSLPDHGAVIEPVNLNPVFPSPSPAPGASVSPQATPPAKASPSPSASPVAPRRINSRLPHVDDLAWSPDGTELALAVNGGIQVYSAAGKDGDKPVKTYPGGGGVTGLDWSGPITGKTIADVKAGANPQQFVDALLNATKLPAAADTSANRPFTLIYLWAFDSSKPSPIASIADASPATLAKYPPLGAMVNFHHWIATGAWTLLGGCIRYRVVIAGSIPPVASTLGLVSNTPCLGASPSASPSHS